MAPAAGTIARAKDGFPVPSLDRFEIPAVSLTNPIAMSLIGIGLHITC